MPKTANSSPQSPSKTRPSSADALDAVLLYIDTFYSFGINYTANSATWALSAFFRDRKRGVSRYNRFRYLLRMATFITFEELAGGNAKLAQEPREVYGDIELVDTLVASHSEILPRGFGFSDMAFGIFILMASRRLKRDCHIAGQWDAETYTMEGFHWAQYSCMTDILTRHFPELRDTLRGSKNTFPPWEKISESTKYGRIETNTSK
ncbi:peroxidase family protein [Diplocarpon rosae]|nr:peroxidase family protein [Diplocarpon rosae]